MSTSPSDDSLPPYVEASTSNGVGTATLSPTYAFLSSTSLDSSQPVVVSATKSPTSNPQRYSSLFPTSGVSALAGPPPSYELATSSLPDRINRRPESPEKKSRWGLHLPRELAGSKPDGPPPKPEGVPLEEVVDRFGNRKRELKWRSTRERLMDKANFRAVFQISN